MATVWGSGGGGAVLVVDGLGSGMVLAAGFDLEALQLLPHGRAWPRHASTTVYKLTTALSQTFARVHSDTIRLRDEMDLSTSDESLAAWEAFAGLPEPGISNPPVTLTERRAALTTKLFRRRGLLDRPRARAIAAELGYTLTFVPSYRPFKCGSACGQRMRNSNAGWPFVVVITATPSQHNLDETLRSQLQAAIQAPKLVLVTME